MNAFLTVVSVDGDVSYDQAHHVGEPEYRTNVLGRG